MVDIKLPGPAIMAPAADSNFAGWGAIIAGTVVATAGVPIVVIILLHMVGFFH